MNRIFLDMDGVVVDFDGYKKRLGLGDDEIKGMDGAYLQMEAMPGAIEGIGKLIGAGYEVWLATKPPTGVAHAYSDKAEWVFRNLPGLKRRLIITHDKGLLGDEGDFLVDDQPEKANSREFRGSLLEFGKDGLGWPEIVRYFGGGKTRRVDVRRSDTGKAVPMHVRPDRLDAFVELTGRRSMIGWLADRHTPMVVWPGQPKTTTDWGEGITGAAAIGISTIFADVPSKFPVVDILRFLQFRGGMKTSLENTERLLEEMGRTYPCIDCEGNDAP